MFDFGISKRIKNNVELSKLMKNNAEQIAEYMHVSTTIMEPCDSLIFFEKTGLRSSLDFSIFKILMGAVLVYSFDQELKKNRVLVKFRDYFNLSVEEKFEKNFIAFYKNIDDFLIHWNQVGNVVAMGDWVINQLKIQNPNDKCLDFLFAQVNVKNSEAIGYYKNGASIFAVR